MNLFSQFKQSIQLQSILQPHDKLILAVSGGIDSIVLLDLFSRLQEEFKFKLIVAHLNHNVRGKKSAQDAEFVKKVTLEKGLIFQSKKLNNNIFLNKSNFQERARKLRYSFLIQVAKKWKATKVLTAHQADDQVETFLMRLLRGAGVEGLKGIEFCSSFKEEKKILLIRPLLPFSRETITNYAKERKLKWREDSTNQKVDYLRNRIRHRVLAEMKQINPRFVDSISNSVLILQEENRFIDDFVSEFSKSSHPPFIKEGRRGSSIFKINLSWLNKQKRAIRYRIYRMGLLKLKGDLLKINRKHIDFIEKMVLKNNRQAKITLPDQFAAFLTTQHLIVQKWRSRRVSKGFFS